MVQRVQDVLWGRSVVCYHGPGSSGRDVEQVSVRQGDLPELAQARTAADCDCDEELRQEHLGPHAGEYCWVGKMQGCRSCVVS